MRKVFGLALMTGLLVVFAGLNLLGAADEKPKYTIKEVMKKAHAKDALKDKVIAGNANKTEKEELLVLYTALSQNKPPAGEDKSWKEKTEVVVVAAKAVVNDDKDGIVKLKKALDCKACHQAHKGK